jgi:hypothetical protein
MEGNMVTGLIAFIVPIVCGILILVIKILNAIKEMNQRLNNIEASLNKNK